MVHHYVHVDRLFPGWYITSGNLVTFNKYGLRGGKVNITEGLINYLVYLFIL